MHTGPAEASSSSSSIVSSSGSELPCLGGSLATSILLSSSSSLIALLLAEPELASCRRYCCCCCCCCCCCGWFFSCPESVRRVTRAVWARGSRVCSVENTPFINKRSEPAFCSLCILYRLGGEQHTVSSLAAWLMSMPARGLVRLPLCDDADAAASRAVMCPPLLVICMKQQEHCRLVKTLHSLREVLQCRTTAPFVLSLSILFMCTPVSSPESARHRPGCPWKRSHDIRWLKQ